jgi:hypothetical protein
MARFARELRAVARTAESLLLGGMLLAAPAARADDCLTAGGPVTLRGTLEQTKRPAGPEGKSVDTRWLLRPETPACVIGGPAEVSRFELRRLDTFDVYDHLLGEVVTLLGTLRPPLPSGHPEPPRIDVHALRSERCLDYAHAMSFTGRLEQRTFAGEPGDKPYPYWVLALDRPICVNDAYAHGAPRTPNGAASGETALQLVFPYENGAYSEPPKAAVGRRATVKGQMYMALRGWHHETLLIDVKELTTTAARTRPKPKPD